MKTIAIPQFYCGPSGQKGLYNRQEVGLARAFAALGCRAVVLYPAPGAALRRGARLPLHADDRLGRTALRLGHPEIRRRDRKDPRRTARRGPQPEVGQHAGQKHLRQQILELLVPRGDGHPPRRHAVGVPALPRAADEGDAFRDAPLRVRGRSAGTRRMARDRGAQHPGEGFLPRKGRARVAFPPGQGFHAHQHPQHAARARGAAVLLSLAVPAVAHPGKHPALRGRQHHPVEGLEPAAGRLDRAGRLLRHRPAVGLPDDRGRRYGAFHTPEQSRGGYQLEHQHPADDPVHPLRKLLDGGAGLAARHAALALGHHPRTGGRRPRTIHRGQLHDGRRMRCGRDGGRLCPARTL